MRFGFHLAIATLAIASALTAQTTTNVYADSDSYVANGSQANANFGGDPALGIINYYYSYDNQANFFVHFDVANAIPSNAVISEARVYLTPYSTGGTGNLGMDILEVPATVPPWSEYGITWTNQPQPPVANAIKTNFWYNYTAGTQAVNVLTGDASTYPSFLALVQRWHANAGSNYGLCFRGRQAASPSSRLTLLFTSREGATGNSYRPRLRVTYTVPNISAIQGIVRIGGVPASNVPVTFVSPSSSYGPVSTDASGSYTISQISGGPQGYIKAVVDNLTFYHTPQPLANLHVVSDLNITASGNLTGIDVEVPRPVMLVHGIWSGPSRWAPTEAQLAVDLVARLSSSSLQITQARITRSLLAETDPAVYTIQHDAQMVDQQIRGFRAGLTSAHGVQGVPFDIVAHSKGGLVARSYLHNYAGQGEIKNLITLGTPHGGFLPLLYLPPEPFPTSAVFEMHPLHIWGTGIFGLPWSGSFGQVVTNLKGAHLTLVGCSTYDCGLWMGFAYRYFQGWTTLRPPFFAPTGYWATFTPTTSGGCTLGDGFIDTWSSQVYLQRHTSIPVYQAFSVPEPHTSLPTTNTIETVILPCLDLP